MAEATRQELEAKIAKLRKDLDGTVPQDRYERTHSMAQRQIILDEIRYCKDELAKIDKKERESKRVVTRSDDKTVAQSALEKSVNDGKNFKEMTRRRVKVNM